MLSPLLKYIPRNKVVWCPWDTADSEYVKQIGKTHKIVYSDNDLFDWEPKQWDILISNPPFSEKAKTFERVVSFCKPFACLVSLNWLHMRAPFRLIERLQLFLFNRKIDFVGDGKVAFATGYFCQDFLSHDLIVESLL